jgi:2-polyprenyl-3-methyl-5-hydroxy-6-metoxy-1,4-benzoquinol methylase
MKNCMDEARLDQARSAVSAWAAIVEARRRQMAGAKRGQSGGSGARQGNYARRLNSIVRLGEPGGLLMDMLRDCVRPDMTVLDVGAGPGRYAIPLAALARQVIAVEPSRLMADYLRHNLTERSINNVTIIETPWEEVGAPAADIVVCSHVLYDVLEIEAFIRKLDKKTNGICYVSLHTRQFDFFGDMLWPALYAEPVAPMPLFDDLLAVLSEVGIAPTGQAVMEPIARHSYDDIDDALDYALERLAWPDNPANRQRLAGQVSGLLEPRDGRLLAPVSPPAGIVWWAKEKTAREASR